MENATNRAWLDDQTFTAQFENLTLDPGYFSHLGHLRIAWLYLSGNDVDTAVDLVSSGIRVYAENLGATTKFHVTITDALVRIMAARINSMEYKSWQVFLSQNPDLCEDAIAVLLRYYSEECLFSERARTSLIQPDIQPIAA